jgi:predicted dehydrogenase
LSVPLRVVLVGCGYIAQAEHVPALLLLQPEIRVVATADCDRERCQAVAALFHAPAFSTLTEALRTVEFEAVIICTPAPSHPAIIAEAALAGKAILVEKPVAYNLREARDAVAAVELAGAKCMVAYHRRYDDDCLFVKKLISSGEIGEIRAAVSLCRLVFPPHFRPYATLTPQKATTHGQDLPADWLTENSIHHINLLRFWLGDVVQVHSAVYRDRGHNLGMVTLEFSNHVLASHHQLRGMDCGEEITVYGTSGNLRVELWYPHRPYRFPKTTLFTIEPPRWQEIQITRTSPYINEIAQFHKYVRGEGDMWSTIADSCQDLEVLREILDRAVYIESGFGEV